MKTTLYYACFTFMESGHLYRTYEEAKQELEHVLRMIYGRIPQYHDGFCVRDDEFNTNELIDMAENPYTNVKYLVRR